MRYDDCDGVEDSIEVLADTIAEVAAPLIAARECTVNEAIEKGVIYARAQMESAEDITRTRETMADAQLPTPGRKVSKKQILAIQHKIAEQAMEAAESNFYS